VRLSRSGSVRITWNGTGGDAQPSRGLAVRVIR
jgi:hypothetical protein